MKTYLIMDLDNLTQHELIEVRLTQQAAQARVDELNDLKNKHGESASWIWDERDAGELSVKITWRVTTRIESGSNMGQKILHEEAELKIGQYNEYYLPALIGMGPTSEMWIEVEIEGVETKIHLKR